MRVADLKTPAASPLLAYQFSFDLYAAEVIAVACLWWLFHFSGHQVRLEFRLPYRLIEVVAFHYEAESNFKQAHAVMSGDSS